MEIQFLDRFVDIIFWLRLSLCGMEYVMFGLVMVHGYGKVPLWMMAYRVAQVVRVVVVLVVEETMWQSCLDEVGFLVA